MAVDEREPRSDPRVAPHVYRESQMKRVRRRIRALQHAGRDHDSIIHWVGRQTHLSELEQQTAILVAHYYMSKPLLAD